MANNQSGNRFYVDTDGVLKTGPGKILAVQVVGGSATTRLLLYDGTDATGNLLFDSGVVAINDGKPFPIRKCTFATGLYADITTTAGYAFVYLD